MRSRSARARRAAFSSRVSRPPRSPGPGAPHGPRRGGSRSARPTGRSTSSTSRRASASRGVLWPGGRARTTCSTPPGPGAAFLDYDRDGRLDVYLVNGWRLDGSRVAERGRNALYRQRGDGTFEDVTDPAGVGGEGEWGAGVTVADYDNDGWPDILVTNFGPQRPLPQPRRRALRERGGAGRASRPRAGTRRRRSSTPTATAGSTSTSRSTSTARSRTCCTRSPRSPGAAWSRWPSVPSA